MNTVASVVRWTLAGLLAVLAAAPAGARRPISGECPCRGRGRTSLSLSHSRRSVTLGEHCACAAYECDEDRVWARSMTISRRVAATARCGAARVAISVSPLIRSKELRNLELSWSYDGARPGDQVALYDYDPVSRRQWDSSSQRNEPVPDVGAAGPGSAAAAPPPGRSPPPPPHPYSVPSNAPAPYDPYWGQGPRGPPAYPYPSNGWSGGGGGGGGSAGAVGPGGSLFPPGFPRDAFSGRARRQAPGDELQSDDPGAGGGPPLAVVPTDGLRSGWRATSVQERHVPSGQLGYTPRCLNYWVVYERPPPPPPPSPGTASSNETEVLAVACLRTRPTWMSDFRAEIGGLRLVDLFIPGTHDSASIQEDGRNTLFDRYTVTQDESILGQLIYGVRYIDLRVGFYSTKDVQWWANHGPVRMTPLHAVLSDIKAFLGNTNEIVILDIQNFPAGFGKDNKVHLKLVHLLETELGDVMAYRDQGRGWVSRLQELWDAGRRLIVAYDKEDVLPASRKLWPAVRQFWGDAQTPDQLTRYAESIVSQQYLRGFAWALMAELTPNARLIATNPTGSLRRLAHAVNRNVTAWAEGPWGEVMNTLAVDFVRSTGVVEAALWHNLRRGGVDVCNAYRLLDSV
ncbi:PI-PLC X domain-containing protein 1 [Frankliniella fusca]|uniref:PI-PLC X domain-containing protein 1 n=1 Tax=Frankliniella fusca TaxID=407009 RepID=A0AAE1H4X9_9NEOP|nr:PI-PLC X domain-containing protein 1 [Frankliniella fusca]